ncbi:MAG: NAD+ synthase [Pseudomonadota bacterium]
MQILMAQINTVVGDFEGNTQQVIDVVSRAVEAHAQPVVVFPELTLCGYPPEDLLLRPSLATRVEQAMGRLLAELPPNAWVIVGFPRSGSIEGRDALFNSAAVLHNGSQVACYNKQSLPNYQVFDEKRYFYEGKEPCVFNCDGVSVAITICEDIWVEEPARAAAAAGAELLLNLNASPYHQGKQRERIDELKKRAKDTGLPIVYVNQVGGQDELVFDGGSLALDRVNGVVASAENFQVAETWVEYLPGTQDFNPGPVVHLLSDLEATWNALVLGVRDYVNKNGFPGVVLGLSGGVDSALTLAIAVEALGADRVEAIMMPFRFTSSMSIEDAAEQCRLQDVRHSVISIEPIYDAFMLALADEFEGYRADTTEENLQARCRGVLLMSVSNKKGSLVLTTGNKSELAVGYSTLYGDMAGGFDVLKDVPKTLVYELCHYRNSLGEAIPERVITRPPSAELAPDQKDEDSLPPYDVLDRILELYVERDYSAEAIVAEGIDREHVERAVRLVDLNEYKRRQAPIGVRISQRAFGRDRRYPITSSWRMGD